MLSFLSLFVLFCYFFRTSASFFSFLWFVLCCETIIWNLSISGNFQLVISSFFFCKIEISLMFLLSLVIVWSLFTVNIFSQQNQMYIFLMNLLGVIVSMVFLVNKFIIFYTMFEFSLFPILLMVMGWGYQPERIIASISMMLYTMVASLPLLAYLIFLGNFTQNFSSMQDSILMSSQLNSLYSSMLILAFLVKIPMYTLHLWLPKAHVEAPVAGSMFLAAILLKLGGLGIWRFLLYLDCLFFNSMVKSVAITGGFFISALCMRQTDIKVLIAYSSVAHMSLVILCLLGASNLSSASAFFMMLAHGTSSSALFAFSSILYKYFHTRSMILMNGTLIFTPYFSMMWFMACAAGMASPPSFNLMAEILSVSYVFSSSYNALCILGMMLFFSVAYSLILYSSPLQGQLLSSYSAGEKVTLQNFLMCFIHLPWVISLMVMIY